MSRFVGLMSLVVLSLVLAACGAATPAAPTTNPSASNVDTVPVPDSSGAAELILAAPRDLTPGPQDPYYAHPTLRVWESLVATDNDWTPQPQLATAWEVSDDGLSWTFSLRDDVRFSDGSPFNADVVIANVERNLQISPRTSPFYSLDREIAYGDLDRVEKVDDYTVRFIHNSPELFFPDMLANYYSAMFAPASFDENGDFADFPIGSGPFMITERVPEQHIILEPNPYFRGSPPASERIQVRTIPDPNTRASALRAGEIHGVLDLGAVSPAIARELVQTGSFAEATTPIPISHYLYTNLAKAPWDDVRLRQAVSLVIDRGRISDDIFLGYGIPAGSMLNGVATEWHDDSLTPLYDPLQAADMAAAVLGDERHQALLIISSVQVERGYPYKQMAEYIQAQLRQIGIDAEIRILEGGAYREATESGAYDLAISTHGLANSEPTHIFQRIAACNGLTNQRMNLDYCNEEIERLLAESKTTRDSERQREIAYELQAITAADLPAIPLFHEKGVVVFSSDVEGYNLETSYWVTLETARRNAP